MEPIKRAIGDRPLAPDLPGLTRFVNEELKPLVKEMRARINVLLGSHMVLVGYAQGSEPTVDGPAMVLNTTTNRPRFSTGNGSWVDL